MVEVPCGSCHESVYLTWCRHCIASPDQERWPWPVLNPVQTKAWQIFERSPKANLVVATGTGTGKTACAEFALAQLSPPAKALVMEPLKALVREKVQDWGRRFPYLKFVELTSDADLGSGRERNEALKGYDVIVCSYEMLDSMTRKHNTYTVLHDVRLLVIDEVHELGDESRGGGLDGALTRYLMAYQPRPQVIALSATFDNITDLVAFLEQFVQPVELISLPFSPIEVTIEPLRLYPKRGREIAMVEAIEYLMRRVKGGILAMCLSIPAVESITYMLNQRHPDLAVAHYSELSADERHEVEDKYRAQGARVIVSTPTLLAGVNIPAQGIVLDISYFDQDNFRTAVLPSTKIRQATGRVGRLPWYKTGHVIYLSDATVAGQAQAELAKPMLVRGTLFQAADEVLNTEIQLLNVLTKRGLLDWYERTYSRFSNGVSTDVAERIFAQEVDWLVANGFAVLEDRITGRMKGAYKGLVALQHHVRPRFMVDAANVVRQYQASDGENDMVGAQHLMDMLYPLSESRHSPLSWTDRKMMAAIDLMAYRKMLAGGEVKWTHRDTNHQWVRDVADVTGRLTGALSRLGNIGNGLVSLNELSLCFARGCVPPKLARLSKLLTAAGVKGLGYKRLLLLYANGVTTQAITEGRPPRELALPRHCRKDSLFDATPEDFYDFTPDFGHIMPDSLATTVLRAIGRQAV